jgi:hypothetical protein
VKISEKVHLYAFSTLVNNYKTKKFSVINLFSKRCTTYLIVKRPVASKLCPAFA